MSNKKSFLAHFMTIGLGTLINMILGLITTPVLTRVVDPTEYGQLSMFTTYTSIAVMILCLGLDQALVRFYYDKDDLNYKRTLLRLCIMVPFLIATLGSVIIIIISLMRGVLLNFKPIIIVFLCINVVTTLWNRISLLVLRLEYDSRKYAISNVIHRLSYLIISVGFIYIVKDNYFLILVNATWLSLFLSSLYAVLCQKNLWTLKGDERLQIRGILKYSLPIILSMGLTTIFQACDKLSIKHYCTYADVGIYSSALTIVSVFAIIQTTFNTLWSPVMIEHLVKAPEDRSFIEKGNKYITIIMFAFGLCLIFGKDVFTLLLGEKYREAASIMPFLIFNPIMYTISETTQCGIEYSKKSYHNITISLVACITNIIGNTVLVPLIGSKGAAISTGLSYIIFFVMRTAISNHYYNVNFQLWKIAIMIIATSAFAYLNTFYQFSFMTVVGFIVCILLLLLLYLEDVKSLARYVSGEVRNVLGK